MEFFRLLWLNLRVSLKNALEFFLVVTRYYYSNVYFCRIDLALLGKYFCISPFRISRDFLSEHGAEDVYTFGETPLTTMELIADECGISAGDYVLELGCGRGRTCFWLNSFKKCRVAGIEYIPAFVEKALDVKKQFAVDGVDFILTDMLEADFTKGSVIYLYGTCYKDQFLNKLIKKMEKLPKGTKIITVSYSLEEYGTRQFTLVRCFPASFTWGAGDVYLQVRK